MNDDIELIRREIIRRGYMTATQIKLELLKKDVDVKQVLKSIIGNGIHKIKYTNFFVRKYTTKDMYFYNPNLKDRYIKKKKRN